MNKSVSQALAEFLNISASYIGKEIELQSKQPFFISYNIEDETMPRYQFQYGWPQSGSVFLSIITDGKYKNQVFRVSVTAPSADKEFVTATFSEKKDFARSLSVDVGFGIDMSFNKHTTFAEIEANPNAMRMIELATQDLSKAVVLGESHECVPEGETRLPAGRAR